MERLFTDFPTVTYGSAPRGERDRQPVIGLTVNIAEETSRVHEAYIRSVLDAGGIPVMIPATTDREALREMVNMLDGLILTGGADIGGEYFGERTIEGLTEVDPFRDAYDFMLLRLASDRQVPVFGICRGVQVINAAFGGTLWQDLPSEYTSELSEHNVLTPREQPVHSVNISPDSLLASILGKTVVGVNSRHHQAIKKVAEGFRVTAVSPDGVVEAIEGYPSRRIFGVQWHPENMAAQGGNADMKALFRFFVSEAWLFREAKRLHEKYLTVDSHCDTPMLFGEYDVDIGRRDRHARVDLAKMAEGRLDAVFVVAYIPQGERDDESNRSAREKAVALLDEMIRQVRRNGVHAGLARTFAEADELKERGKRAVFLGLENGYALGRDLENLRMFRDMGVTYVTLCHNGPNDICDSAMGSPEHDGLSPYGREVVREMNRLGMLVDMSHASEKTFYDVLELSRAPVVCSHSSARALCDHPRNLTDDQIRALAAGGGVAQVCLYGGFLVRGREATVIDAMDHIDHIARLAGCAHVGIGSDFDGGGGIAGCDGANEYINITVELLRRGYGEKDIAGILGGNLRRVVGQVRSLRREND